MNNKETSKNREILNKFSCINDGIEECSFRSFLVKNENIDAIIYTSGQVFCNKKKQLTPRCRDLTGFLKRKGFFSSYKDRVAFILKNKTEGYYKKLLERL